MAFQAVGKALFRAHVEGQLKVNKFGENYISVDYFGPQVPSEWWHIYRVK